MKTTNKILLTLLISGALIGGYLYWKKVKTNSPVNTGGATPGTSAKAGYTGVTPSQPIAAAQAPATLKNIWDSFNPFGTAPATSTAQAQANNLAWQQAQAAQNAALINAGGGIASSIIDLFGNNGDNGNSNNDTGSGYDMGFDASGSMYDNTMAGDSGVDNIDLSGMTDAQVSDATYY
jgi:hypothetical protein